MSILPGFIMVLFLFVTVTALTGPPKMVGLIRGTRPGDGMDIAKALQAGGIPVVEMKATKYKPNKPTPYTIQ